MENIVIKPMESDSETDGKGRVHYRSWQETYRGLVDDGYLAAMTEEKCIAIARRWRDNILVAKDGERVVGFAGFGAYRDDTLPDSGEVYAIYLLEEYQGRKIGYRLMREAVEKLKVYDRIALWVLEGNEKAIRFYERFGFHFDGVSAEINLGSPARELRMIFTQQN
ncbi:MAG: GNAT family N-acetyltransferase [Clostridia bacterium]|nr:GNAT family N-acetyltransferase [Clostridia bacterium]